MQLLLLLIFGALGTLARYGLQGLVQHRAGWVGWGFPAGTLVVNLIGCFCLGLFSQYALHRLSIPPEWRMGVTVGFFGAFTTFSTFGYETIRLLEGGEWTRASIYVGASVFGGLLAAFAGIRLGNLV